MKGFILVFVGLLPLPVLAASFDCAKASTTVERLICSDKAVSALDSELSAKYKAAFGAAPDKQLLKSEQIAWMTQTRNKCASTPCLENAYASRIATLGSVAGNKTVVGVVQTGSLDSTIELPNGDSISFMTDSHVADAIFASCKEGDTCKVTGIVDSSDDISTFKTVLRAALVGHPAAESPPADVDLRVKHAKRIAALGFNKSVLSSYLYLQRDLVNPPSKFITFESFLAALLENPRLSSITPLKSSGGALGIRWKLQGAPAGGVFFNFEDGEAYPASYLDGGNAVPIQSAQDGYVVSVAILKMAAPAVNR